MKNFLSSVAGAILTILAVFMYGKSQGRKDEVVSKNQKAEEVKHEVQEMGDDAVNKRVRGKWVRNKNK